MSREGQPSRGLPEALCFVEPTGTNRWLIRIGLQRRFEEALWHAESLLERGPIGSTGSPGSRDNDLLP